VAPRHEFSPAQLQSPLPSCSTLSTLLASSSITEFQVPWNKMPPELMSSLSAKERPLPSLRREMVRIISSDIHAVCPQPGRRQLRSLANKIVSEYPQSFRDMVAGDVVGSGHDSLLMQLERRCCVKLCCGRC